MCGICGIYNFKNKSVTDRDIEKMNNTMISRGPDDKGSFLNSNFGFGMRRLSIIDIEKGKQPIFSNNKRFVTMFNGEIYNYKELRQGLTRKGYLFHTRSDTEVIANLFQDKGVNSFLDLNGMFAISIWDQLTKKLYIARDRIGIKPLYYVRQDNSFYFCSTLKGILEVIEKKPSIDTNSFFKYLAFSYVPYPASIYKNVFKLEPGHFLVVKPSGDIDNNVFWSVDNIRQREERNIDDLTQELYNLLKDATRIQMRSDVPFGTFLSGGFDSSTIVAMMSKQVNEKFKTITINFENGVDETKMASLVAEQFGTDHIVLNAGKKEIIGSLEGIFSNLDEPISDNSIFPTLILSKLAVNNGLKVILNGTGGDELFGGYLRYQPRKLLNYPMYKMPDLLKRNLSWFISNFDKNIAEIIKNPSYDYYRSISGINISVLNQILRDKNDIGKLLLLVKRKYQARCEIGNSNVKSFMLLDFTDYLVNDVLALLDKMTMAVSLEGRVPFLDNNLIDFAFGLDDKNFLKRGELKWLLKETMKNDLPSELINFPKSGFSGPVNYWLNSYIQKQVKESLLHNTSDIIEETFNMNILKKYISLDSIPQNYSSTLFSLYIFNEWHNFSSH